MKNRQKLFSSKSYKNVWHLLSLQFNAISAPENRKFETVKRKINTLKNL